MQLKRSIALVVSFCKTMICNLLIPSASLAWRNEFGASAAQISDSSSEARITPWVGFNWLRAFMYTNPPTRSRIVTAIIYRNKRDAQNCPRNHYLSLYWCPQTLPLPWHTSRSRLQVHDALQMSSWLRRGKHRMCSSNSAGRSVSFFVWDSEIAPFRPKYPSADTDDAIFTVYPDYLIS